jgi:hypothetical protein
MAKRLTQAELIEDFKQYVSQFVTATLATALIDSETRIRSEIQDLRQEMNDGFAGITDIVEMHQTQLDRHETDIQKLKLHTKLA